MEKYLIAGDFQAPYHDPDAVSLFLQIGADLKPDVLVLNGDFVDWRVISTHYPPRTDRPGLIDSYAEEVEIQRELLHQIIKEIRPKRKLWNDGNHEWRLFRLLSQAGPQVLQILGVEEISGAVSVSSVLGLKELGFTHSGEYPAGCWLRRMGDGGIWVEHGYATRKHAGYLATALIQDRMANVVVGHGERLALKWKRALGRHFFGLEGGNMSIIGEPGKGEKIYSTVPHTSPILLDHAQGFAIIYAEGSQCWPSIVKITDGRTVWNGRRYRA